MKVLVTGAGGMLGRDVVLAAGNAGHDVVGFGHTELDVGDEATVRAKIELERPDVVINCAAWTDVDGAEEAEEEALAVNGAGAGYVAAAAAAVDASVVYVSSDYVFDGAKGAPYVETDETAPLSAYGRTKLAGEGETVAANKRHFVVRSSWLFGIGGSNFVETMLRLSAERETVSVVDDQRGQPTSTAQLAALLVRLLASEARPGVYHGTGSGETTWHGFARAVFAGSGLDPDRVLATTTAAFPRPAHRPAYSVLSHDTLMAAGVAPAGDWAAGLTAYLSGR